MNVGVNYVCLQLEGVVASVALVGKNNRVCREDSMEENFVIVKNQKVAGVGLEPATEYFLQIVSGAMHAVRFKTIPGPRGLPKQLLRDYVSPGTHSEEILHHILLHSSSEYLWTDNLSDSFWSLLFQKGLFALPHQTTPFPYVLIPNPLRKFCFDLTAPIAWNRSIRSVGDTLALSVIRRSDFSDRLDEFAEIYATALLTCKVWHERFGKSQSTWITDSFIETVVRMIFSTAEIEWTLFSLTDSRSGQNASLSLGYQVGRAFMDFTACTPIRDRRSAGKRLIAAEGDWLRDTGKVELWYLGFELEYMRAVSGDAKTLERELFQTKWDHAAALNRHDS